MEIIEEKYITKYEALEIIKSLSSQNQMIQNVIEIIKDSIKKEVDLKSIEEAKKELKNLGLKDREIIAILNYLPESIEDLNVLFGKNIKFFDEETQKKVIEIVKRII